MHLLIRLTLNGASEDSHPRLINQLHLDSSIKIVIMVNNYDQFRLSSDVYFPNLSYANTEIHSLMHQLNSAYSL